MPQGKYVKINDLNMYYEIYGTGQPLILLHGGFGGIWMFEQVLPTLAKDRQVIGVELQGHGHTADIDRPFSFESMAGDIAALIGYLRLGRADVMGYSVGGGVAQQTAIQYPEAIRKLVVVSAPCKSDGWHPEVRAGFKSINAEIGKTWVGSPMHQAYTKIAPRPEDWPALVGKMGQMLSRDYDWSQAIAALKMPTLFVIGDADSVRPAHAVEFFGLLGGGQRDAGWDGSGIPNARLAILPGATHYDILSSPALTPAVIPFLDAPMPPAGGSR